MTELILVGTLHHLHRSNENYPYECLYTYVEELSPQVLGLEIRAEDLGLTDDELAKLYPREMVELRKKYLAKCDIRGFDWLGEEVEGKAIPDRYFETAQFKVKEHALINDVKEQPFLALIDVVDQERMKFASESSIKELHDTYYDRISTISNEMFKKRYMGTEYEVVYTFSKQREEKINHHVNAIVSDNIGKKIVIVTGRDHIIHLREYFKDNDVVKVVTPDMK